MKSAALLAHEIAHDLADHPEEWGLLWTCSGEELEKLEPSVAAKDRIERHLRKIIISVVEDTVHAKAHLS